MKVSAMPKKNTLIRTLVATSIKRYQAVALCLALGGHSLVKLAIFLVCYFFFLLIIYYLFLKHTSTLFGIDGRTYIGACKM